MTVQQMEHDQAVLDLEEANARLRALRKAIQSRDELVMRLKQQTAELRSTRSKLKIAEAELAMLLNRERRLS